MRTVSVNKKLTYLPGAKAKAKPAVPVKNRATRVLLIIAVLYFTILLGSQYWRSVQLQHSLETIHTEIQTVKAQNEAMSKEIERLHSPAYLEQKAREDLGMVRSGELLFYFQNKDKPSPQLP
ncbi:MAG TPA: septum formation initiator family protein [Oscillospiraceae bacterium]|nr:septum formation initiator family protein [Oscillospiraceae bacterium]